MPHLKVRPTPAGRAGLSDPPCFLAHLRGAAYNDGYFNAAARFSSASAAVTVWMGGGALPSWLEL
jgi:hypothetical protein